VFGAKRLSVVRYLKQNNKTNIATGFKLYNKVFAVTDPDKNVTLIGVRNYLPWNYPHAALV
jgi:hypothetical protein